MTRDAHEFLTLALDLLSASLIGRRGQAFRLTATALSMSLLTGSCFADYPIFSPKATYLLRSNEMTWK